LEKMNVLYAGVDNPMTVAVSDVPDSCLLLQPSLGKIRKGSRGHYLWNIGSSDTVMADLSIFDTCSNELTGQREYRVKQVPVEIYFGGKYRSGTMGNGEFKAQMGIIAYIICCVFDARCNIVGFDAHFFSKKTGELWTGHNTGARFEGAVLEKQQAVKPGDWVIFRQISYRCPGMKQPKFIDTELFFEIK